MKQVIKYIAYHLITATNAIVAVFYFWMFLKIQFAYAAEPKLIAVDGDTVKSSRTVYRLQHYDTPEIGHAKCDKEKQLGLKAKTEMQNLLTGGHYRLSSTGKKEKYGRTLATLYINGKTTGDIFVSQGLAIPYEGRGPKKDWCAN